MPWPTGGISTADLDSGADSPALARSAILAAVQQVNDLAAMLGVAAGAASLDAGGKIPSTQIPAGIVPTGVLLPYGGASAPSGFLFCDGSAVSRTTYAALFAVLGSSYGAGDGSTTFNLPDMRDRVPVGKGDMGGTAVQLLTYVSNATTTAGGAVVTGIASTTNLAVGMSVFSANVPSGRTIASIDSATQVTLNSGTSVTAGTVSTRFAFVDTATLGASGGAGVQTLTTAQIPSHTHTVQAQGASSVNAGSFNTAMNTGAATLTSNATGGGQAHSNVQPSAVCNFIIKT